MPSRVLRAVHPKRGLLYAAIDPSVRIVTGGVRENRFAARLAPFVDEASARAALVDAGVDLPEDLHGGR